MVFKRGPQKEQTKPYKVEKPINGMNMQNIVFEGELFKRVSTFYKESNGGY